MSHQQALPLLSNVDGVNKLVGRAKVGFGLDRPAEIRSV